ncbi:MAG: hypothetical protein HY708_01565 [Ignavibacteriae bacterium]|nr:hypothetical protein [Ignavibacteriota bacterium]
MSRQSRVYLSGGMEYATNEGRDWRDELHGWLERELGCRVFNPNHESEKFIREHAPHLNLRQSKFDDLQRFQSVISRIVELDCGEIAEHSDFVVCYWDEAAMRGAGTKGELTIAKYFSKPVYIVTAMPHHDIPGWVLGCATQLFSSFDELKSFLSAK